MDPQLQFVFERLGLAVLLGLLVGLQREHAASKLGGLRTFPLVTVLGTVCALLGRQFGGWLPAAGLVAVMALLVVGNLSKIHRGQAGPGLTTEAAMLLMYVVGALVVVGPPLAAIAVGVGTAVLLQFKVQLHGYARRLHSGDLGAIMRFALMAGIVLPVLPDRAVGPFAVFNPREIWLLVVLIVGISLLGYLAYKLLGRTVGIALGGLLGGAISSTATTVSFAQRVRNNPPLLRAAVTVILLATAVVYARVLIEVRTVAPAFLPAVAGPIVVMAGLVLAPALALWWRARREAADLPEQHPPANLKGAIFFALLYVAVLLGLEVAKARLGQGGLYAVAALSGLTDMDAITLSSARMTARREIEPAVAWRLIVTAAMANLAFKAALAGVLGGRRMLAAVGGAFALSVAGGAALILLWPDGWVLAF